MKYHIRPVSERRPQAACTSRWEFAHAVRFSIRVGLDVAAQSSGRWKSAGALALHHGPGGDAIRQPLGITVPSGCRGASVLQRLSARGMSCPVNVVVAGEDLALLGFGLGRP